MRLWAGEQRRVVLLCWLTDAVLVWAAYQLAAFSRWSMIEYVDFALLLRDRAVCVVLFAAFALILDGYRPQRLNVRFDSAYYATGAVCLQGIAALILVTMLPESVRMMSRREILLGSALGVLFVGSWRALAASLIGQFPAFRWHFAVVGPEPEARRVADAISGELSRRGEIRYVSTQELKQLLAENPNAFMTTGESPKDAIIVPGDEERADLTSIKELCERHFRNVFLYPALHEVLLYKHHRLSAIAGVPVIQLSGQEAETPYAHIKRVLDFAAALVGLLVLSPALVLAALAVKLTSPGGVFYTQERLGTGGRPFLIYKFRTMVAHIQARDETGHVLAQPDDPRITRVGKFLRKHRIDEIPQLYNVLRGDMSLVGPRPVWREYYEVNREQLPLVDRRLAVRPGLTCLSHVLGTYSSEARDRLVYDLVYINSLSFMTDLRILLSTVYIVLSGKGAQ